MKLVVWQKLLYSLRHMNMQSVNKKTRPEDYTPSNGFRYLSYRTFPDPEVKTCVPLLCKKSNLKLSSTQCKPQKA